VSLLESLKKLFGGGKSGDKRKVIDVAKRFDLRGRTGQGSMSKVWQAYDKDLGRIVALKLLDKEKTIKFEERFKMMGLNKPPEGEICMALKHKNLVQTYEHGLTTVGEPYMVMEWIDGLGLNYLIETRNVKLQGNRINYLCQLCDALDYLHHIRFLHRDLCPRNVMVDKEGMVKLIDFGLTIPYTPQFCQPGNRTGTADYLAPELIKRMKTDSRVDMFALGVTAFELFTHLLPWERALSSEETLKKHLNAPPRNAGDLNPELGADLVKVLMKSIEREREMRYRTAREFKEALQSIQDPEQY
jgi:eukaryotic-like serine/threonine-protein kinase